jgi:stage IV sporulation protein FB
MSEDQLEDNQAPSDPDHWEDRTRSLLRTLSSLVLYALLYYFVFRDLRSILLLLLVIIVHEGGHYLAMRTLGYRDIKLFFIPFFGALISGNYEGITPFRRALMILAGPLPGIMAGAACLLWVDVELHPLIHRSGLLFLLLNLFNLLPVKPLDGGQLLFTAFPRRARMVQLVFMITAMLVTSAFLILRHQYLYLLFPVAALIYILFRTRREADQVVDNSPSQAQQIGLLLIWLAGFLVPMAVLLFQPIYG